MQIYPKLELKYIIQEKSQISELLLFSLKQLHSLETCFIACISLWSRYPELMPPRGSVLFPVIKGKCSLMRAGMDAFMSTDPCLALLPTHSHACDPNH